MKESMTHHAYFYEGPQSLFESFVDKTCASFGVVRDNNPDVHVRQWEKFGIEDAQQLQNSAQLRSTKGKSLFILGIASITSEAQQALLKLFEEPQKGTTVVLLIPHGILLPTLRSRMLRFPESTSQHIASSLAAATFLESSGKVRSEMIGKLLKDEDNQKEHVRDFLNELESTLYVQLSVRPRRSNIVEIKEGLEDIAKVRSYVADRSPSFKMLLEYLALSLPLLR